MEMEGKIIVPVWPQLWIGAGIGVGNVWASYITAISRNPASKEEIGANIWIGFAVTEAIALFALIVALIALFG